MNKSLIIHNPYNVDKSKLPKGFRFLYEHEIFDREKSMPEIKCFHDDERWVPNYKGQAFELTYCTNLSVKELYIMTFGERGAILNLLGIDFNYFL